MFRRGADGTQDARSVATSLCGILSLIKVLVGMKKRVRDKVDVEESKKIGIHAREEERHNFPPGNTAQGAKMPSVR